jgi:hypothetical protein
VFNEIGSGLADGDHRQLRDSSGPAINSAI